METSHTTPETPKLATTTTDNEGVNDDCNDNFKKCQNQVNICESESLTKNTGDIQLESVSTDDHNQNKHINMNDIKEKVEIDSSADVIIKEDNNVLLSNCDSQSSESSKTLETNQNDDCKISLDNKKVNDDKEDIKETIDEDKEDIKETVDDDKESNHVVKVDCHSQDCSTDKNQADIFSEKDHKDEHFTEVNNENVVSSVDSQIETKLSENLSEIETKEEHQIDDSITDNQEEEEDDSKMALENSSVASSLNPFGEDDVEDDDEDFEIEIKNNVFFQKCTKKENITPIEKKETPPKEVPLKNVANESQSSLNPFGEFDSDEEQEIETVRAKSPIKPVPPTKPAHLSQRVSTPIKNIVKIEYPKDYNPFGDDDDEEIEDNVSMTKSQTDSLNPFGEFDSEDEKDQKTNLITRPSPTPTPRTSLLTPATIVTPTPIVKSSPQSLRKSPKKSRAPLPPTMEQSKRNESQNSLNSTLDDDKDALTSRTPTPTPRRNKPTENQNSSSSSIGSLRAKKKAAPPIPAVKREVKSVSIEEIEKELNEIGDKLPGLEDKRIELEKFLLSTKKALEGEAENDEEFKKKKQEFLDVAKEKCKLSQKQKELMYMKREAKLEEQHMDIEYRLRTIMSKQDALKTEEDHVLEAAILKELVEVVENRNDIIENMIRDENKEIEEYIRIIAKVFPDEANNYAPTALDGSKSDIQTLKSKSASKLLKKKTITTLTSLKLKKKKNKDSKNVLEIKDFSQTRTDEEKNEDKTSNIGQNGNEKMSSSEHKKKSNFSLGRSTLKKLTLKSTKTPTNKQNNITEKSSEDKESNNIQE